MCDRMYFCYFAHFLERFYLFIRLICIHLPRIIYCRWHVIPTPCQGEVEPEARRVSFIFPRERQSYGAMCETNSLTHWKMTQFGFRSILVLFIDLCLCPVRHLADSQLLLFIFSLSIIRPRINVPFVTETLVAFFPVCRQRAYFYYFLCSARP